jgi:pyruvate kinase
MLIEEKNNSDELFQHAVSKAKENNYIKDDDVVVITAGIPLGKSGTTNMLKVEKVSKQDD